MISLQTPSLQTKVFIIELASDHLKFYKQIKYFYNSKPITL